ncbi:MAG TPA: alkaline phosphatase family protein [Gemmatimonadales bacterium]|jgi:phospholipase C|nr:alkaline phosphatase family protein [Gemmatimonadales bacterium]
MPSSPERAPTARALPRRAFLSTAAAAAGGLALACVDRSTGVSVLPGLAAARLPDPEASGIDHVVVVMMENRSFDHLLGWLPGADGRQAGLTYFDAAGTPHSTYPLAPDFQGCGHGDPDHSYAGARVEYDGGACDGWLRVNDTYSIGYYEERDLAFLGRAAPQWATFDQYFCAILGPTFPNRFYQHAGQTDRISNTLTLSTLPTIWDRLRTAGLKGRYYFGDLPFVALWGDKYFPIARPNAAFFADCAAGTLPQVAYVDPPFLGEASGTGPDDHPFNDIRAGEAFLNRIYQAVTSSPAWDRTVLFINFDEWGGFFDHVPPPAAPIPAADQAAGNTDGLRGFRTPALLISPFARRARTSHRVYDHTSVLRLIEWRWGLEPLSIRDATAHNLAHELDFTQPDLGAPTYTVPAITPTPCPAHPTAMASAVAADRLGLSRAHWADLGDVARRHGWGI